MTNTERCRCSVFSLVFSGCLSQYEDRNSLLYESMHGSQYRALARQGNESFVFRFTEAGYGNLGYDALNFQYDASGDTRLIKVRAKFLRVKCFSNIMLGGR